MSNRRIIQHRQQRDTNNKELAELKVENRKLKRQISRLHKQLAKSAARGELAEVEATPAGEIPEESPVKPTRPSCPVCGSEQIGSYTTPTGKKIMGCKSCKKWKGA